MNGKKSGKLGDKQVGVLLVLPGLAAFVAIFCIRSWMRS
jgi:hypothetical protein